MSAREEPFSYTWSRPGIEAGGEDSNPHGPISTQQSLSGRDDFPCTGPGSREDFWHHVSINYRRWLDGVPTEQPSGPRRLVQWLSPGGPSCISAGVSELHRILPGEHVMHFAKSCIAFCQENTSCISPGGPSCQENMYFAWKAFLQESGGSRFDLNRGCISPGERRFDASIWGGSGTAPLLTHRYIVTHSSNWGGLCQFCQHCPALHPC